MATHATTLEVLLWGRHPHRPMLTVPRLWIAIVAGACLLMGLSWLSLVPLVSWNGLVTVRNRLRCPLADGVRDANAVSA
jgi:ABC-type microcin C transport system permease subunit YejE